mgnify:CR=1 FL=1
MIIFTENFTNNVIPLIKSFSEKYGNNHVHEYFFDILKVTKDKFQFICEKDKGQSWRNESGAMLENLVVYLIQEEVKKLGYELVTDDQIKKSSEGDEVMSKVYRNIVIRYGEYSIMPDGDIIIYRPDSGAVVAIISCKNSLRERYTQTLYWKLKLSLDPVTKSIKMYFITLDKEEGKKPELDINKNGKPTKSRVLLEYEMDGVYVGRNLKDESNKVKMFDKFIDDLKELLK